MKIKKVNVPKIDVDHKVEYSKSVLWNGLNNAARKDALKENDGDRIIRHWRFDLPRFHNNHHTKYVTHAASLMIEQSGPSKASSRSYLIRKATENIEEHTTVQPKLKDYFKSCSELFRVLRVRDHGLYNKCFLFLHGN